MIPVEELIDVLDGATDADTAEIVELEQNAVAFVQTQTRRYFGPPKQTTEVVKGKGTSNLWLRHIAIDEVPADYYNEVVVSVVERQYAGNDGTAITDFQVRVEDGEVRLVRLNGGVWTYGYEYTVTYWHGYPAGEEPGDIRQLVVDLVKSRWNMRELEGLRSESIGGYSYTRFEDTDLDMEGQATIAAWRRLVIA